VTPQLLAELAGDTAAIAIALVGWFVAVRSCRQTTTALLEENRRLVEALARAAEDGATGRAAGAAR
jgi:hypothetical protein